MENFGVTSEAGGVASCSHMFRSSVPFVLVLQNQLPCAVFEEQDPYKCRSEGLPFHGTGWLFLSPFGLRNN